MVDAGNKSAGNMRGTAPVDARALLGRAQQLQVGNQVLAHQLRLHDVQMPKAVARQRALRVAFDHGKR